MVEEMKKLVAMDNPAVIDGLFKGFDARRGLHSGECETCWQSLDVQAEDGARLVCRLFKKGADEPHLLFFPSERDSEEDTLALAEGLGRFDITLMAVDYRGRGESEGQISISAMPEDAEAVYRAVVNWRLDESRVGPLVVMGRSIGAAIALGLAASLPKEETLCLILESAFDRTIDFLTGLGIQIDGMDTLEIDPFLNRGKMQRYTNPVLFLHSSRDEAVSLFQVEWLVAESRSKATQFQIVPSPTRYGLATSGMEALYYETIKGFVHLRMGRRPQWKKRH